jgi:MinD-like ATPase involved in chromosome partitioning or flagellar assembly
MSSANLSQKIETTLVQAFSLVDPEVQVQVRRNSFGWFLIEVSTRTFEKKDLEERKLQVNTVLATLNLHLDKYPFSNYQLLTPEERAKSTLISPVQIPLWSEILLAPEPEVEFITNDDNELNTTNTEKSFVVTFYSFKGGVGRSTALAFVANKLTTYGYRIVMIDFDLEAPGLSFAYPIEESEATEYGVLDYMYQRYLTPEENQPVIEDCIRQIPVSGRGELYLIPAGAYDEGYIHRLADLNIHALYQGKVNPIHQLLEDVKKSLRPDIILIDARTGFTDMGAVALFDQADLGIICFSPTKQSYAGLEWVVKAASKQRKYNGIPDLRFLLTPMPPVASIQQQEWLGQAADWITEHWGLPADVSVDELYYYVPYNPSITTLESLFEEVPTAILESYEPVADVIRASLPEKIVSPVTDSEVKISDTRGTILNQLRFQSPNAQDIDPANIPAIFQRTGDFPKFLQNRYWLIRGAKGTGKTFLFRLFVEQADNARKLAKQYEDLDGVQFVPGHGREKLRQALLSSESFEEYEQSMGAKNWVSFWLNYLLIQLAANWQDFQTLPLDPFLCEIAAQQKKSQKQIVEWLKGRSTSLVRARDELQVIDEWLGQHGQRAWILYDELDAGLGQKERRGNILEALLEWWLRLGPGLSYIFPKILLREDIWASLNFNNKTHYSSRTILLHWDEENLLRLVLRQALSTSQTFATIVRQQSAIELIHLDADLQLDTLRKGLYLLWGEKMGSGKKAFTYNWIQKRISDYQGNRFPRSLILLLQYAVDSEKNIYEKPLEKPPYDIVLRPRSLINALPKVSFERMYEVKNEYSEFADYLDLFATERSPISVKRLEEIWQVDSAKLKELVTGMITAGILKEYPVRSNVPDKDIRYSIAELYLSGLKMTRFGQH